jgi:hypothetical protein
MVKHLTKVAIFAAAVAAFIATTPPASAERVFLADYVSTCVIEAENFSWRNPGSNNGAHLRSWELDSVAGGNQANHPRTTVATWDTNKALNTGPSGGEFIFVSTRGDNDTGSYSGGDDDPPNVAAGVGWLIKFSEAGRYFVLPRILAPNSSSTNRAKWQFDWYPPQDLYSGVGYWGRNNQNWIWDPGPNIQTPNSPGNDGGYALYVPRAGTYWFRAYHRYNEFSLDQFVLIPWPNTNVIPYVPENTDPGKSIKRIQTASFITTAPATAQRAIGAPWYIPGAAPVPCTVTLTATAAGNAAVTETLPVNWTVLGPPVASAGVAIVVGAGNQIAWNVPVVPGNQPTLFYLAIPNPSACGLARWLGVVNEIPYEYVQVLRQAEAGAGDGWPNGPIPWQNTFDIRPVPGTTTQTAALYYACDQRYELIGSGEDIWNTGDEMRMVGMWVSGDCAIQAIVDIGRPPLIPDFNSKAGIFIRDSVADSAPYFGAIIRRDGRINGQWRLNHGGSSSNRDANRNPNKMSSAFLKVTCRSYGAGSTCTVSMDTLEGNRGTNVVNSNFPYTVANMANLKSPYFMGLGVTAHRGDSEMALARGIFTNVVTTGTVIPAVFNGVLSVVRELPTTFTAGLPTTRVVKLTMSPYVPGGGGGTIITSETMPAGYSAVNIVASTGTTALVGNRIIWTINSATTRVETLTYNAVVAAAQCRTNAVWGASPINNAGDVAAVTGATTINWQPTYSTVLQQLVYGLLDNGLAASPYGALLSDVDIGGVAFARDTLYYACDGFYYLYASGGDIWGTGDAMGFIYAPVLGDFAMAGDVKPVVAPDYWSKGGLMARANLSPGAANAFIIVRGDNNAANAPDGIRAQVRPSQNGDSNDTGGTVDAPNSGTARLFLSRSGTNIIMGYDNLFEDATERLPFTRSRNTAWKNISVPGIPNLAFVGLAVTSHNNGYIGAFSFTSVTVSAVPYTRTIGAITRTVASAALKPGNPTTVTLTIAHLSNATSVVVTEVLPKGVAMSISNGGVFSGNTIRWTIAPWTANVVRTYTFVPYNLGAMVAYEWAGGTVVDNSGWVEPMPVTQVGQVGVVAIYQQGRYPDPTYAGTQDAHVVTNTKDSNQGANDGVEEGDWNGGTGDHKKVLVKFNLTGASTATLMLLQAQLALYQHANRRDGNMRNIHDVRTQRVLKAWNEGTGNGYDGPAALTGEVSWNHAQAGTGATSSPWQIPGLMGTSDAGPFGATSLVGNFPQWNSWGITQDARAFMTTPSLNQGWKVSQDKVQGVADNDASNPYVQGAYDFMSSENSDVNHRPMLIFYDSALAYQPLVSGATRTVSPWFWGDPTTVTIVVTAASAGTSISITDVLPAGWVVSSVLNGGSEVSPGVVRWVVTPFLITGATVRYLATYPTWPIIPVAEWTNGSVMDPGGVVTPIPNTSITHANLVVLQQGRLPDPSYAGTADAHVITWASDNNSGANNEIEEGDWNGGTGDHKKSLIRFDLSSVALSAANVTSAEILLYHSAYRSSATLHTIWTQKVLKTWNEGTGNGIDGEAATTGVVTWNHARYNTGATSAPWEIPGLMGVTDAGPMWRHPGTTFGNVRNVWISLDVTRDVRDFLTTPASNKGWKISQDRVQGRADDDARNYYALGCYDFISRNNADVGHRPMLIIWTTSAVPVDVSRFMLY